MEALITINNKLQQKEAAAGLLNYVMHHKCDMEIQVGWYEKLHNWDKALELYQERLYVDDNNEEARLGQMRCLEALGEWNSLHSLVEENFDKLSVLKQARVGRLAAASAWGINNWGSMDKYIKVIPSETQDGAFYRAVLAIHNHQFDQAQNWINVTRDLLDTELTAMASESYERAYGAMVMVQMLAELEEVVQYKLVPERRQTICAMWWQRLQAGQRISEDWQRIIQVHSLVLKPHEDMHTWLKYAALCRKSGSLKLSHKTLVMLLGSDPSERPTHPLPISQPQVTYAYAKYLWTCSDHQYAYNKLETFLSDYLRQPNSEDVTQDERRRLLAR